MQETKYEPPFQYVNGMFNRRVMDSNPRTDYHWKADVANSDDSAIIYRFGATDNPLGINFRDMTTKSIFLLSVFLPTSTLANACISWRQTSNCDPDAIREEADDKSCTTTIHSGSSGYCIFFIPFKYHIL